MKFQFEFIEHTMLFVGFTLMPTMTTGARNRMIATVLSSGTEAEYANHSATKIHLFSEQQ